MGGASAAAAAFGGVLPPGITGTNDRSTLLVSNLVAEVCFLKSTLYVSFILWLEY
jgi:hypothetical protein